MRKSWMVFFLLLTKLDVFFAQVGFINETAIQFASDAAQEKNTGFDWLRNQFEIVGEFDKFSFNSRLRLQVSPVGNRLFSQGATFITDFLADDEWIQSNIYLRPLKGLELAVGTNIDYSLRSSSNWGDYAASDWAKTGFAVKYQISGFEIGLALPAYLYNDEIGIQPALTKTTFALKYTLENVFSIGAAYFADFKTNTQQEIIINFGLDVVENAPLNIFADYVTTDIFWTHTDGLNYPANDFLVVGIDMPVFLGNLIIEPEFSYTILTGADYKTLNYVNPWFISIQLDYEFEHLIPRLWFSYESGTSRQKRERQYRIDVIPEILWKTKYGILGVAFNLIIQKNPNLAENALGTYVGWALPITFTVFYETNSKL